MGDGVSFRQVAVPSLEAFWEHSHFSVASRLSASVWELSLGSGWQFQLDLDCCCRGLVIVRRHSSGRFLLLLLRLF
jgi:hypothetical protein